MDVSLGSKINRLLSYGVYGGLYFSEWLSKMGYSAQLVKQYKDSGWMESLTHGVMFRRNEKLTALAAIYSFNTQTGEKVRIAAHSALELHGFSHSNSKLLPGDRFVTGCFFRDIPLYLPYIIRGSERTSPFIAGRNGGLTCINIIKK